MSFDDQPVGQHKKMEIPELPPEEGKEEAPQAKEKVGTLEERLANKNSKIRFEAFTELVKLFSEEGCPTSLFSEHYSHFPKYLGDSHPGAQEKALEALCILLNKSPPAMDKSITDILNPLLEKGCTSAKPMAKAKAMECFVAIAENENSQGEIMETVLSYISSKSTPPKVVVAALQVLTTLLITYGSSVFPVKDAIKIVAPQGASTNAGIRTEVINYFKEAHRWVKDAVNPSMETLRSAQQEELKKLFAEETDPPVPIKTVKGRKVNPKEDKKGGGSKKEGPNDTYLTAEEVPVLKKFGETWCNQVLAIKKWSEKKTKLEELIKAISVERIKNEPITELGQALKKLINDSNVVVVNLAIKIIGLLALGLRVHFATYAKHIFELIIQKCKDKKTSMEAKKCMENLSFALKMEDMIDVIKEALGDKSPLVRTNVCGWLETVVLPKIKVGLAKTMSSAFSPILVKLTDDAVSDVRDSALSCLGVFKGIIKDPALNKIIGEMNTQKQEKIIKAEEQIVSTLQPAPEDEKAKEKLQIVEEEKVPLHDLAIEEALPIIDEAPIAIDNSIEDRKISEAPEKKTIKPKKEKPSLKPKKSEEEKIHKGKGGKSSASAPEVKEEDIGPVIGADDAASKITEILPSTISDQLDKPEWKERSKGLQDLNEWINANKEKCTEFLEVIIVWLKLKLKDFKESNQGVMKEALVVLGTMSASLIVTKKFAFIVVPPLVDKMSDVKLIDPCTNIILGISDCATPNYVASLVIKAASSAKSVNTIKGTLSLVQRMLESYGPNITPIKLTVDYAKFSLSHSNQQIRAASTSYLMLVYTYIGDALKQLLITDLKEATYKAVEAELSKAHPMNPKEIPEPKRKLKGEAETETQAKKKNADALDALMPRINIASQITSKIINGLSDGSMKHRQEAKESIEKILVSANYRIQAVGLNPLMSALKARMSEPCKNLAKGFITLIGNLAQAIGSGFKQYSKIIVQPIMYNLADKQSAIKNEAIIAMNKIAEAAGAETILQNAGQLLEKDNPDMRTELLQWILKNKEALPRAENSSLVNPLIVAMQDRSKEIRGLAENVIAEVMPHVGLAVFISSIRDLKPVVKSSLKEILEKYKPAVEKGGELTTTRKIEEEKKPQENTNLETSKAQEEDKVGPAKAQVNEMPMPIEKKNEEKIAPLQVAQVTPKVQEERKEIIKTPEVKEEKLQPNLTSSLKIPQEAETEAKEKTEVMLNPGNEETKATFETSKRIEMATSRSTNDLKHKDKKEMIDRKESNASTIHGAKKPKTLLPHGKKSTKKSPTKSDMSSSSVTGGLIVETVVLSLIGNKEKRAENDKTIKWPVNEIRDDYVEKLKKSLKSALHPNLFDAMFAPQFKKNLSALAVFTEAIKNEFSSIIDIMDLLFKWIITKMIDQTNTAITKAILEFLKLLFAKLAETKTQLLDFEAAAIVPMLCERTSINNATFKQCIRSLIKDTIAIYDVNKVSAFLVAALESKNQKTKMECLGIIKEFATQFTAKIFVNRDIKVFGKLFNSSDSQLKSDSLDILTEIFINRGEQIWSSLGDLTEKNKEILKKKFAKVKSAQSLEADIAKGPSESTDGTIKSISLPKSIASKCMSPGFEDKKTISPILKSGEDRRKDSTPSKKAELELTSMGEINFNTTDNFAMLENSHRQLEREESLPEEDEKKAHPYGSAAVKAFCATPNSKLKDGMDGVSIKNESLDLCLEKLRNGDISKRVDALVVLNDKATSQLDQEKDKLISNCNMLFDTFTEVLKDIFSKLPQDVPIRFAKYFMTVISKVCALKAVLREVNEKAMSDLAEQLLTKLLYQGLEKMGENNEGEYLIKTFNSTMLRILENCNPTRTFIVLIGLFRTYKGVTTTSENINILKLPGLIVKCILKLTKVVDSLIPTLDVGKVLVCLHEYLLLNPSNSIPKSANDETGTRIIKTIINELVKALGEKIWEYYSQIEKHDKPDTHIKRWINIILKSTHPAAYYTATSKLAGTGEEAKKGTLASESSDELKEIFKGLNSQATFHEAIRSLSEYMLKHPQLDLKQYFGSCSKGFSEYVISSLQKYNDQSKTSTAESKGIVLSDNFIIDVMLSSREGGETSKQKENLLEERTSSTLDEYRAKMALLKQKLGTTTKDDKPSRPDGHAATIYATQHQTPSVNYSSSTNNVLNQISKYKAMMQGLTKK